MSWFTRRTDPNPLPPAESDPAPKRKEMALGPFLLSLALFVWVLRSFIVAPFYIPSGSMFPTLLISDYVLVAKWPYGYSRYSFPWGVPSFKGRILTNLPERGDVVVFRPPGAKSDWVKRAIGLPGDTIEVRGGTVILNGKPLQQESMQPFALPLSANTPCRVVPPATAMPGLTDKGGPACMFPQYQETLPNGVVHPVLDQVDNPRADDFGPIAVPAGHVFMMGDNRDDSMDSRFSPAEGGIGPVPVENLVGRALFIIWSTDGSASWVKPWTWFTALRSERIGTTFRGTAR
jgi:signal peptidase I